MQLPPQRPSIRLPSAQALFARRDGQFTLEPVDLCDASQRLIRYRVLAPVAQQLVELASGVK
ncbi:MAG: hypothetical protein JWQ73_862 [Variovorax sp.]|nr:hypothetical protein [Variovorax sp.]